MGELSSSGTAIADFKPEQRKKIEGIGQQPIPRKKCHNTTKPQIMDETHRVMIWQG